MKQNIVIKLHVNCDECRSKAMKIAAKTCGVTKIEIQGKEKDELVVIGDQIDPVKLTRKLRKKLHFADILKVNEEKEKKDEKEQTAQKKEENKPTYVICDPWYVNYPVYGRVVCNDPCPDACSIL